MPRSLNHKKVQQLPPNAITVKQYALREGVSTSLIYHRLKKGKADYNIVVFQGINFVTPITRKTGL